MALTTFPRPIIPDRYCEVRTHRQPWPQQGYRRHSSRVLYNPDPGMCDTARPSVRPRESRHPLVEVRICTARKGRIVDNHSVPSEKRRVILREGDIAKQVQVWLASETDCVDIRRHDIPSSKRIPHGGVLGVLSRRLLNQSALNVLVISANSKVSPVAL